MSALQILLLFQIVSAAMLIGLCIMAAYRSGHATPITITVAHSMIFAGAALSIMQTFSFYMDAENLSNLLIQIGLCILLIVTHRRPELGYPRGIQHDRRRPGAWMRLR